eukprot:9333789-Alexandrium_andersonii.AAC.1
MLLVTPCCSQFTTAEFVRTVAVACVVRRPAQPPTAHHQQSMSALLDHISAMPFVGARNLRNT